MPAHASKPVSVQEETEGESQPAEGSIMAKQQPTAIQIKTHEGKALTDLQEATPRK